MILSGKDVASTLRSHLKSEISMLTKAPKLRVILVWENSASLAYIAQKKKAAAEVGIEFELLHFIEESSEEMILEAIYETNERMDIHGVLVQLPLPKHIDTLKVIHAIAPEKDIDGYTDSNIAGVLLGRQGGLQSCTPKGVMQLLAHYGIALPGQNAVVIGYGAVGKPMAAMLSNAGATVTVCNHLTPDVSFFTKNADIVVVAVWKPGLLTAEMIRPGATIIDVGITRTPEGLRWDADFEGISQIANISPVPGGVGPMTVAMLLQNTLEAYRLQGNK